MKNLIIASLLLCTPIMGNAEDVKSECLSRLEKCGDRGGIVLGPTHLVEPEVPWENILAIKEAAEEFSSRA